MATASNRISALNFDNICRICVEWSENFVSITKFNIVEMIKTCASVQVWVNDGLPNQICEICLKKLENSFSLSIKCKETDVHLRSLLKNGQVTHEDSNGDHFNTLDLNVCKVETNDEESITIEEVALPNVGCVKVESLDDDVCETVQEKKRNNEKIVRQKKRKKIIRLEKKSSKEIKQRSSNEHKRLTFHFSCEECNATFYKAAHLGIHMHEVHETIGTKCELCPILIYHPSHMKSHMKGHVKSQKYQCETCGKKCSKLSNLKRHRTIHETQSLYACQICGSAFKNQWSLNSHNARVHTEDTQKPCFICGKPIKKSHMHEHVRTHRPDRPKHTCNICGLTVHTKTALKKHIKIKHEGETLELNHLCNVCGHRADSAARLKVHQRMHTGERPYACDRCDKTFVSLPAWKRHVRVHLELREFVCDICSRPFYTNSEVTRHRQVHSTERPHQCFVCSKTFRTKIYLKNHRLKMHGDDQ